MHLVLIAKLPEFTPEGEVIPGQCEPYTGGWKLRLIEDHSDGRRDEEILRGTYYELRRIQRRCPSLSPDEIRKLATEAAAAMAKGVATPLSVAVDESTPILGVEEVREAMREMEFAAGGGEELPRVEWAGFSQRGDISVASVKAGGESPDPDEFGRVIGTAMALSKRGLVVDFAGEEAGAERLLRVLRDLGERAKAEKRFFGVAGADDGLKKAVDEAELGEKISLYADLDGAMDAAGAK